MINQLLKITQVVLFMVLLIVLSGCSSSPYIFKDDPPVLAINDTIPIGYPSSNEYEEGFYYYNSLFRRPIINALTFKRSPRSGDVNSFDHVPGSSWYSPRLGYRTLSTDEILHGPEVNGPPELPFIVIKVKDSGSNPGLLVKDQRGLIYMLKFDVPGFEGIQTTTDYIVSRLFWAFGYNVPEDYQLFLKPSDILPNPEKEITEEKIRYILSQVPPPNESGHFRSTASQFIEGQVLGPTSEEGVREGDLNDIIRHEDRRTLRALRVFCSFLNHSGIRVDNSLDTYVGAEGNGYVKHYLIDFGEAFGGHGAEHNWLWDGYRYRFQFKQMFSNLFSLGLVIQDWEHLEMTEFPSVGAFESNIYDPSKWNETYQYLPIQKSLPDDNYWAAKILTALERNQIEAIVHSASYPDEGATEYVINTLLERKEKTIDYYLSQVTPLEVLNADIPAKDSIVCKDIHSDFRKVKGSVTYDITFRDTNNRAFDHFRINVEGQPTLTIPIKSTESDYFIMEIRKIDKKGKLHRPMSIHLLRDDSLPEYTVVGIIH